MDQPSAPIPIPFTVKKKKNKRWVISIEMTPVLEEDPATNKIFIKQCNYCGRVLREGVERPKMGFACFDCNAMIPGEVTSRQFFKQVDLIHGHQHSAEDQL